MQQAHLHLIKFALANNLTVSVFDGEEWDVIQSSKYQEIKDCSECADDATLTFYDASGNDVGTAYVILSDEPEESVVDYSVTPFMEEWDTAYDATR